MPHTTISQAHQEGFIRLALALPFLDYLKARDINPRPTLEEFGVSEDLMRDANIYVHSELIFGLLNKLSERAGDRYLGVHVGETFDLRAWPPFSNALQSRSTLFRFFSDFVRLVPRESSSVLHSLVVEADRSIYRIARQQEPSVPPVQVTGFGTAVYVRLLQSVSGTNWDPSVVTCESRYIVGVPSNYNGIKARFGPDPGMQISFPTAWLHEDVVLEPRFPMVQSVSSEQDVSVVAVMRSALRDKLNEMDLEPEPIAKLLGIDPELFLKALKHHGTTLPREIKRLKIDLAKERLKDTTQNVARIGVSLGYSDKAHFTRFFRSQTGMTPTQFRISATEEKP
ncbi:helix-turn-helix domain-containing protein [Phaeobacter sp. NW0010-22]|uniref:AraC family transcriptional regulator n=1 Tax=Phaeobacter sp. NW0010-22 TaxID=3135907 RepID=UPI00310BB648